MDEKNIVHMACQAKVNSAEFPPDIKDTLTIKRETLITELKGLGTDILQLQEEFSTKLEQLQLKKRQITEALHHVEALLRYEGHQINDAQYADKGVSQDIASVTSVNDAAVRLLEEVHRPLHYKEIAAKLLRKSILIPGKNPEATLLSRISRDRRFKRAKKRGMYALSTWRLRKNYLKSTKKLGKAR